MKFLVIGLGFSLYQTLKYMGRSKVPGALLILVGICL